MGVDKVLCAGAGLEGTEIGRHAQHTYVGEARK